MYRSGEEVRALICYVSVHPSSKSCRDCVAVRSEQSGTLWMRFLLPSGMGALSQQTVCIHKPPELEPEAQSHRHPSSTMIRDDSA